MNINQSSWHYRLYAFLRQIRGESQYSYRPRTKCGYISTIVGDITFLSIIAYIAVAMCYTIFVFVTVGFEETFTSDPRTVSLHVVIGSVGWICGVIIGLILAPPKIKQWCDSSEEVRYINK